MYYEVRKNSAQQFYHSRATVNNQTHRAAIRDAFVVRFRKRRFTDEMRPMTDVWLKRAR